MELTEFWTILSANNVILDVEQIQGFKRYKKELQYWNRQTNLISRQDEKNILERHFLHSLSILKYVNISGKARCLDFGTGGGFPGIPIKIASPDIFMTLCDSIKKKLKIAEMFAQHTGLRNFTFEYARVEKLCEKEAYKNKFNFIFARAVAQTKILIDWTLPLLKPNGQFVFLKGGDLTAELEEAKRAYPKLNFREQPIELIGCDWFKQEDKKIIIINAG